MFLTLTELVGTRRNSWYSGLEQARVPGLTQERVEPRAQTLFGDALASETLFQFKDKQSLLGKSVPKLEVGTSK